jgi:hypothetical protein
MHKIMMLFLIIPFIAVLSGCNKAPAPAMQSDYAPMDFDDLKDSFDLLQGVKLKVSGFGLLIGNVFIISKEMNSVTSVYVDTESLSGNERKLIAEKCSDSKSRCNITIYGTIERVNKNNKLVANEIKL